MARPIVLGNPRLHAGIDAKGDIVDLYYPYVGYFSHCHRMSLGLYDSDGGKLSWIRDGGWEIGQSYLDDAPVGQTEAKSEGLRAGIRILDFIHHLRDILLRQIVITNPSDRPKSFTLFAYNDLHIREHPSRETAMFDRHLHSMIHYKDDFYFGFSSRPLFEHYAAGRKEWGGLEGTWRDAEDGGLSGNMVSHGFVDSCVGWNLSDLKPGEKRTIEYYITAARSFREMRSTMVDVMEQGFDVVSAETLSYWRRWSSKELTSLCERKLGYEVLNLLKRSLITLRLMSSDNGALLASTDSDIERTGGDNYNYVWPRDVSWCAEALDLWGYHEITWKIFDFLFKLLTDKGYFLHKYYPTGNFGSTWIPVPFIQIDQTGSVLHAFWRRFQICGDIEFPALHWNEVSKAGKFLAEWRDKETGLPNPSWDLWEERKSVNTYSASAVYAGLIAASKFAKVFGREADHKFFAERAAELRNGVLSHLFDTNLNRFLKSINPRDETIDSSLFAVFYYGVLPANDQRVVNTMKTVEDKLWVKSEVGGLARYEGDAYFRSSQDAPGNPWILTTMYLSLFHLMNGNISKAKSLLEWATRVSSSTQLLPEQLHVQTGQPLSVLPLAWSHAAFAIVAHHAIRAL